MAKEKTKTVDVKLEEDGEEKVVKITIKRPASDLMLERKECLQKFGQIALEMGS